MQSARRISPELLLKTSLRTSMSPITTESEQEGSGFASPRLGHVRWIICAMLFFTTSIDYMDRQVIARRKPTLQYAIGLTEIHYGYIVDAFQAAYATGLLVAGHVVDKIGTRIDCILIMAVWSLSAMGHALANTAFEFGIARFFLGIGESGNFPAAIKTIAEWFPQSERSLAMGIFNAGANVGAQIEIAAGFHRMPQWTFGASKQMRWEPMCQRMLHKPCS